MPKLSGNDIYQGFLARGLGPVQAAALAGNAQQESGFNPAAWNASSGAGGLMQWRNDRLAGLLNYAKATGRDPSDPNAQMDYVVAEMKGPESKAAQAIQAATDVPTANAAVRGYLRYGPNEAGKRLQYSQAFAGTSAAPKAPAAPDTGSQLDAIFGPSGGSPSVSPAPVDNSTGQALDNIFGPSVNPFGTTSKPGTSQYVQDAIAYLKASGAPPPADPAHHPEAASLPDNLPAPVRAFSNGAVESVPVLGPLMHGLRNAVVPALGGESAGAMDAQDQSAAAAAPGAATAGNVFGTVAPFLAVGPETLAGKALGMAGDYGGGAVGNVFLRGLAGAGSGAAIAGADTAVRGGTPDQIRQNMLTGGAVGGVAAPVAHAIGGLVGKGANAFFGKSAPQTLAGAMQEDQQAPEQINQLIQNLGPAGTAADLGPNAESLAGGLASLPGKPKAIVINNLLDRAAGTGDRLNADVDANLGKGQPVGALTDQVTAQQKAAADPLYAAVRPQPVTITPQIQAIAQTPIGKAAFAQAAKMVANDGAKPIANVHFFDYAKQALDDMVTTAQRKGENNAARQATGIAATLRNEIDAQVPGYAQARDAFAGPARVKDAIEQGQLAFSKSTSLEEMQRQLAGLSTSERDGYLAGAQDAAQNMIHNARNDAQGTKTAFQSSNAKDKLGALIGPDKAQAISDALDREATYTSTTGNAVHNSKSAARLAQQRAVDPDAAAIPNALMAKPTLLGLVSDAFGGTRKLLTSYYRHTQNAHLANMLTGGQLSPADAAAVARAGAPRGTNLPGVGAAMAAKNNNVGVPGGNPFLQWADPTNMLLPPGAGGRNGPLRIVVRGATPAAQ